MSEPRVVAIIPARYASHRLHAKPLADICGRPMVQHVYERVAKATLIDTVIVATDDERIASVVREFGGNAVMTPASIQTGTDRTAHVAGSLQEVDIVVNVQGDEPIIEPAMIDEAVAPLVRDGSIPVGTLVRKIESDDELTNPGIVKVVLDRNSNGMYFSRSPIPFGRDLHPKEWLKHYTYYKHFGLYVFRREFLTTFKNLAQSQYEKAEKLEQLRILEGGYKIRCTITSFDSVTVDTQKDLDKVRAIVSQRARQK